MKFSYSNQSVRLYNNQDINVIQRINPFTNTEILCKEDAIAWVKEYVLTLYGANQIFIEVQLDTDDDVISINKDYVFKLKESTRKLTGKYEIKIQGGHEDIVKEVEFIDGETTIELTFNKANIYEFIFDSEFYIGQTKYLHLVDESEDVTSKSMNNLIVGYKFLVTE